ncbi:hypothetical protein ONZ45_g17266 [Pleurotus djamor]|nr:hypothetical protein ONZ45_g17266 [Pleurotus djamor]
MQSKTTLSNKKQCRRPITDVKLAKAMLALRILMRRSLRPVPVTKSQQKKPVERMYQVPLWDAVGALAEFEAWKLAVSAGAPHRVLSPVNVSRLLQIGWITRFEAHQCGGLELWQFRKQCLIKALLKARCYDGKHPLVITDDFLGLTDRPLNVGGGSSVIRWEDGEAPWMLAWTGSTSMQPPMKTLVHTFNSRNIPGATVKSSATYEMDSARYTTLAKHHPLTR